jgi:hypothetical protein
MLGSENDPRQVESGLNKAAPIPTASFSSASESRETAAPRIDSMRTRDFAS